MNESTSLPPVGPKLLPPAPAWAANVAYNDDGSRDLPPYRRDVNDVPKREADDTYCNGRTRNVGSVGPYCRNKPGMGTEHPGQGRCKFHGGSRRSHSGRYSQIKRARIAELLEEMREDPAPLDLLEEVFLLRAMTIELVERWESIYGEEGALMKWYESFEKPGSYPKPKQLPDFSSISQIVDKVGAMVDRIHKQKESGSMPFAEVRRVLTVVGEEVAKAVAVAGLDGPVETRLIASIRERIGGIQFMTPIK